MVFQYDFEMLQVSQAKKYKSFVISEYASFMGGLRKCHRVYLLEEIENKPFHIRVTYFTQTENENDCRDAIKMLIKMKAFVA